MHNVHTNYTIISPTIMYDTVLDINHAQCINNVILLRKGGTSKCNRKNTMIAYNTEWLFIKSIYYIDI